MWWCHHTRNVCIHHTSVPVRWIIHGYILSHWYFKIFFFVYYGRQLRQLTNVQIYRLLGHTPRNGKSNVLVDLHPLAHIVPCVNVLLFWMDTICRQQPLQRKKYIMCRHTFQDTTKPME